MSVRGPAYTKPERPAPGEYTEYVIVSAGVWFGFPLSEQQEREIGQAVSLMLVEQFGAASCHTAISDRKHVAGAGAPK